MSDYGKQIRLNRILRANKKKTLVVAFDHPLIFGPIPGTLTPAKQIRTFADNGADAVLMNLGTLKIAGAGLLNERAPRAHPAARLDFGLDSGVFRWRSLQRIGGSP